jgi:hypothetical protein
VSPSSGGAYSVGLSRSSLGLRTGRFMSELLYVTCESLFFQIFLKFSLKDFPPKICQTFSSFQAYSLIISTDLYKTINGSFHLFRIMVHVLC